MGEMRRVFVKCTAVILAVTFIAGQVFAGQISVDVSRNNLSPSSVYDPKTGPQRSDNFIKETKPGQIGNGIPLVEIARGNLPLNRLTLEGGQIVKLREAIKLAVTLSAAYSQPEHSQIVKSAIHNLIDLNNKLVDKAYLYNLIANGPEDYSAGFCFVKGFTGLTKELVDRLPVDLLAQYLFHENIPESDIVLSSVEDERSSHRAAYNEIQSPIFGKEAVERLGKEIRAAINEKLAAGIKSAVNAERIPVIGGNWKMAHGTRGEAEKLLKEIAAELKGVEGVEIFVAPSTAHLAVVSETLKGLEVRGEIPTGLIKLGAQNMYAEDKGAYTGGISAAQLKDMGVTHIILGHSELRRNPKQELTGESNANVNRKVKAALKHGLIPVVCVGENNAEREAGKTAGLVSTMVRESLDGITPEEAEKIIVAYEPVWAIGTGKTATPEQAEEIQLVIRKELYSIFGSAAASGIRIQYGGSVTDENIGGLMIKPNIDGALVGGASLKPKNFSGIVKGARNKTRISGAETFAEFVEMAKAEARALKLEAEGLGRIFVVGISGSDVSKAALEIGSAVGATRTLIPEMGKVDIVELIHDLKNYYQKYGFGLVIVAHGAKIEKDRTTSGELFDAALKKDGAARAIYETAEKKGADEKGYLQFEKYADIVTAILSAELGKKEVGITVSQAGDIDYDTTITAGSVEKQVGTDLIDEEKYRRANAALFAGDEVKTEEAVPGFDVFAPLKENTVRYGILTGGGLASGHNQVIAEAVREASRQAKALGKNIEIIGLKSGWAGLVKDKLVNQARLLTLEEVERYEKQGGSMLGTSRTNPYSKENIEKGVPQTLADNIKRLQLNGLITCGGDDTNGAAAKLQAQFPELSFIGVPKTMDNDIPLPGGALNYGNRTFIEAGILRGQAYKKIAQNEKKIIVFEAFGRNSGFAALGVGAGIQATRTLVREEGVIDFDRMAAEIEAFYNRNGYAIISVAEGIKTDMKGDEDLFEAAFRIDPVAKALYEETKTNIDAFGHPKLKGAGRIITAILKAKLASKGIVIEQKGNLDYGPRSADISSTDLKITNTLGKAAITKLLEGKRDIILYVDNDGNAGEMDLQKELGGRVAGIEWGGANYREYLAANQASQLKPAPAQDAAELLENIKDSIRFNAKTNAFDVVNEDILCNRDVDYLAFEAALNSNEDVKKAASRILMEAGENIGIHSSSMHGIYEARKAGKILQKVTVPANNIRGMAYDTMATGFDVMKKHGGFAIFEIARSEIGYTKQPLYEYSAQVYAAAIRSGYKGKIFIQLDHAQFDKEKYFGFKGKAADPDGAREDIVKLVDEAVAARVFNIDVDPSSLMVAGNLKKQDATHPELKTLGVYDLESLDKEDAFENIGDEEILLRQTFNVRETAYLVGYIRDLEKTLGLPLTIAIGGEDMHVDQNVRSTERSVRLFARALEEALNKLGIEEGKGVIKISVQSGTGHGGITIAGVPGDKSAVKIDMNTLKKITTAAETGGLGSTIAGVVQHGASTVPEEYFSAFSDNDVIEVHLATGYQNKQLEAIRKKSPVLFQKLNVSMVKSSLWTKDGKDGEIKKAIAKYIASYYKKAYGTAIDEALYQKLLGEAIATVEGEKDWAGFTEQVHQEVAGLAQFGGKIQKDDAMITRFAIAEAFYRSYKKVFGLEKKALWNMPEAVKEAVHELVGQNFDFIWTELGFKDTLKQTDAYAPKVPLDVTPRPQALQDAATSIAGTTLVETAPVSIEEKLRYCANAFAANLTQILAKQRDQLFFIGIETDIGEAQEHEIMPLRRAIDAIEKMVDSKGNQLFPNLMVRRAAANELVVIASDLSKQGQLNLNNAFIGARKASVENKAYDTIAGEGRAWIAAIDDSQSGDYLPVFEAITLNMMAYANAELSSIKDFYDMIANKPIDPEVLNDMLKRRIIVILPKATKLDTKQLLELYKLAQRIYTAA